MSGRPKDLTGRSFGRLVVKGMHSKRTYSFGTRYFWLCKCACGTESIVFSGDLAAGHTTSCGCFRRDAAFTHGRTRTPEYRAWAAMIQRCENPKAANFAAYGGRGIAVCDRWKDFQNFLADMGERPAPELSIERKDNDRGYEPDNCKWATRSEQAHNTRVYRNNKSGASGVFWDGTRKKWVAAVQVNGKQTWLGAFDTAEKAIAARKEFSI